MNELTLRVSAVKLSAQPKRPIAMSESIIELPKQYANSQVEYVLKFAEATTLAEQMASAKVLFADSKSLTFLADLLFACPLKHPLRNVLTRLFSSKENIKNGEQTHTKESLVKALRDALRYLASTVGDFKANAVSAESVNNVLVSVTGCLQNFNYGRDALSLEIQLYIPIMSKALDLYWTAIHGEQREDLSPTGRNEFYMYIQTLLRFHVNFMSEFKLEMDIGYWQQMRTINTLATMVATHTDTPWDVRSIAGLSIGHNARFYNQFNEYLLKCQDIEKFEELPIKAAALLVLKKTDYNVNGQQALLILKLVLEETENNRNQSNMLVYMSKHLHTYSKSLSHVKLTPEAAIFYKQILISLIHFSIEHITSGNDTIRHMCANIMKQVLQHAKVVGEPKVLAQLYLNYNRPCIPITSVCLMLQQVVETYGAEEVLQNCTDLHDMLFYKHLGREDSVNTLFKCMMTMAHREKTFPDWSSAWCKHIVVAANSYSNHTKGIEDLISTAIRLEPQVLGLLIDDRSVPLICKLMAMCTARRQGLSVKKINTHIRLAAVNGNDELRLFAITFVVDTPRLSEPYSEFEMKSIVGFLEHNANNPKAHFRQRTYAIMQKMVKRLEYNLAQHIREQKGLKENPEGLTGFVNELFRLASMNLFYTANYGRRWLSMRLLRDLIAMMERLTQSWRNRLPPQVYPYLENCLADSYEHNKEFAANLLSKLQKYTTFEPELIIQKLISVKPPVSLTGCYQMLVYCQASKVKFSLEQPGQLMPNQSRRYYLALQQCMVNLQTGLVIAGDDLLVASQVNPLYGLLGATRLLLQRLDLKQIAEEPLWREYVDRLLMVLWNIIDLMLPIVSSDAPEGHVPAQTGEGKLLLEPELHAEEIAADEAEEEATNGTLTPVNDEPKKEPKYEQVVLLCAWRSIKELSLLLGDLTERAPVEPEEPSNYLLSRKHLLTIGDRFMQMLGEIKHRGAFEQAYVGFAKYCHRYWHSEAPELNKMPPIWLEEIMRVIYGRGEFVACATRRSAGMPYMVQSLICTELKLGTHKMFSSTMNTLLKECESRKQGKNAVIARKHAFNIMRALFRCSELGNLVDEFIGRGIKCAFDSLGAGCYAECNSASLMLSALMIRIFGVERARMDDGELHKRNRMTGRIFFTCYPKLFDYLHDALECAADHVSQTDGGQTLQLEAILLLLSRLYPSHLEGAESSLNLEKFVPYLGKICYVHDKMSRRRACKVLANFLTVDQALAHLKSLCMALCTLKEFLEQENPTWDSNAIHGHMGLALELIRIVRWRDLKLTHSLTVVLSLIAVKLYNNGGDICLFKNIVIVIVDIIQDSAKSEFYDMDLITSLICVYQLEHKDIYKRCTEAGISTKFYFLFVLHLQRLTVKSENLLMHMAKMVIEPDPDNLPADLHQFKIDLWLYILMQHAREHGVIRRFTAYEMKYFDFPLTLRIYYKSLTTEQRKILASQLFTYDIVRKHIMGLATQVERGSRWCPEMLSSCYTLMAFFNKLELSNEQLLDLKLVMPETEPGMAMCVLRQTSEYVKWELIQPICLRLLMYAVDISAPTQNIYLRWEAAHLIDRICVHTLEILHSKDVLLIGTFMRVILQLLVDESDMVRNTTSEIVTACTINIMKCGDTASKLDENYGFLPLVAEDCFIVAVLRNMTMYKRNDDFLIELFNTIVAPFVGEVLENRRLKDKPKNATEGYLEDDDGEIFDKHEVNLYCEGMRVLIGVGKAFKSEFSGNKQLVNTIEAVLSMCD